MTIKTVAILGASGNVGSAITTALLSAGFTVTAITRPNSTSLFPPGVSVRRADPSSFEDLKTALAGQDAVISASATSVVASGVQETLVDAAVAAGVKRFVPSEFGHSLERLGRYPEGRVLRDMLKGKAETMEYVRRKAGEVEGFSWTGVGTSQFFDWCLDTGVFDILVKDMKATIHDSGDEIFSTCTLTFIGRAVTAVLKHEEETRNKLVEVVEFQTTQNELVKALEEAMGESFSITHVKTADVEWKGREEIANGDGWVAFVAALHVWGFADGAGHAVPDGETENMLLGLPAPKRYVKDAVRDYLRSREL